MNLATYIGGPIQTHAYRVLRKHVYRSLVQYKLNPTKWALLGMIFNSPGGIRAVDAANRLEVKVPLITAMAHDLQAMGLIMRTSNNQDRRSKLLIITEQGKGQVGIIEANLSKHLTSLLQGVTTQEMKAYHKVLSTIITNDTVL